MIIQPIGEKCQLKMIKNIEKYRIIYETKGEIDIEEYH